MEAEAHRQRVGAAQNHVRNELAARKIQVTGAVQTVLNAVFVVASKDQESTLRGIPGVRRVVFMPRVHVNLNRAVQLVNVPAAWNVLGGVQNAGLGIKIAVLDTGIDQTHPAFQDDSLPALPGYPKCAPQDCAFTNRKVIVARSYVARLAAGSNPSNPAADSRPDDTSPRDRFGHGTAVASVAAGQTNTGPAATITGVAPKAYVGNYRIFGSPGVNDYTSGDIVISALEDALNDGMDVAELSLGSVALSGPLDTGAACGEPANTPCDLEVQAIETVIRAGMLVVVAAGNEGDFGTHIPTRSTVDSPGTAPSAITVGATTNSHIFVSSVRVNGSGVPSNLQNINAMFGDGPQPDGPVTAPLRDVSKVGASDACTAYPAGSLNGVIAIALDTTCDFLVKVQNVQNAGGVGLILNQARGNNSLYSPGGLANTSIPTVVVASTDGNALLRYMAANPNITVSLDPSLTAIDVSSGNIIAQFSSLGPTIGSGAIKPEVVAVGTDMYMATQNFDVNGAMFSPTRYTVADGTSFAVPLVAGAAALVKQRNPGFLPAQIKSAIVNTATQDVTDDSGFLPAQARIVAVGAGKLDAGAAVSATVTVNPPTASFGVLQPQSLPKNIALQVTNNGSAALTLTVTVTRRDSDPNAQVTIDQPNLALAAGKTAVVNATLTGSLPTHGSYEGYINIQGAATAVKIPYLYVVGDGVPYDIFTLLGDQETGTINEVVPDGEVAFKVIDQFGAAVAGLPVQWSVTTGGGSISLADQTTDRYGIAAALATMGPDPGAQQFTAKAGNLTVQFSDTARLKPAIFANGVVDGASFTSGRAVAPGSYISIFGIGLSDDAAGESTVSLPLAIHNVSVSFDVPAAGLSVPGKVVYVSPGQVNVQAPWELHGQPSAQVKVSIEFTSGYVVTVPLADYAPGLFEYQESAGGPLLAASRDENFALIGTPNPARRGRSIQLYANGLGPVTNQPATGEPAGSAPFSETTVIPKVTIGGVDATVTFHGLAPGFAGLYQLNVTVPPNAPVGLNAVSLSINGQVAKTSNLPVQ